MPPKTDAKKSHVKDGHGNNGNGPGNDGSAAHGSDSGADAPPFSDEHSISPHGCARAMTALQKATAALTTGSGGNSGMPTSPADDFGTDGVVPPAAQRDAAAPASGSAPADVEMDDASAKDKVNRSCDELEKLFYAYGQQLVQTTQELLEQAKGIDAQSAREITDSWREVRKEFQPQLNRCLLNIVDSVPDSLETGSQPEMAHPGMGAVAFRDLLENARTDVTGSLAELIKWFVDHAQDPAAIQSLAAQKHANYSQVYNAVLDKLEIDILERMEGSGPIQLDFGRDSDYGQALEAQQILAKERDELQLQLDGFQKQVEHLKASEADLYTKCRELQDKFSMAQKDLLASSDKVGILDAVTTFLDTKNTDVVGVLAHIKNKYRGLEAKIAELETHECPTNSDVFQDESARVADLEAQLRNAQSANVNLQRTIADYEKQLASGSAGSRKSLDERARELGFYIDASGNVQRGPPPRQVFDVAQPYAYTNRCGS